MKWRTKNLVTVLVMSMLLSANAPTVVMAADTRSDTTQSTSDAMKDTSTISLHDLLKHEGYTPMQENEIASRFVNQLKLEIPLYVRIYHIPRYFRIHKDISAKDVKKIARSSRKADTFMDILGDIHDSLILDVYQHIFDLYYNKFRIAARHGWGIRITITTNSYDDTSTGTSFSLSYIK